MEALKGYVDYIRYQMEETGYTVFELIVEGQEIVCVGNCKGLAVGETVECQGTMIKHPTYGEQFKITEYRTTEPTDVVSIERYLSSGAIKGIGASLAGRIIKKFGQDTMRIMKEEPERLAEIKGISLKKAMEIGVQVEDKQELQEILIFLSKYGISNTLAVKIYNTYGSETRQIMERNPYRLAEDMTGVGFRTADQIAKTIGIHMDSDYRIRCGILYALQQASLEGHCFLPRERLTMAAQTLLEVPLEAIEIQIDNLHIERKLVLHQNGVYAPVFYNAERSCARMLRELSLKMPEARQLPSQKENRRVHLEKLAGASRMELDELQLQAVETAIENGIFILSGGPGTGKTTTINLILKYFEEENMTIMLAAPTGRAAKRMTEATGFEAKTIHRLLELNSDLSNDDKRKIQFERNEQNPLETDVVIIDEMSMVDLLLFHALLKAITPGTRVILVGDMNQLPSVGPGQVYKDLIQSNCFPMVQLEKIFRQAEDSHIVVNAHKINQGQQITLDNRSSDFFFLERNDTNVIYKHMVQLIQDKLPGYVNATPFDIQVLTPMRKGPLGCITLNQILQEYINPASDKKPECQHGEGIFRLGDKVMQIKNNYQISWEILGKYQIPIDQGQGIFNGDMGKIIEINQRLSQLVVEFDDGKRVTYPFTSLEELELSYAVTIHKSQGSEYAAVIMPLLSGPIQLMNRNLLYTGITRAKKCLTILGSRSTLQQMIENTNEAKRYTSLQNCVVEFSNL